MSKAVWRVVYYDTPEGESIVEEQIRNFGKKDFARISRTVNLLEEYGIDLGHDYIAHIEDKIWELRVSRYRVLFFAFHDKQFVLLHAFMKKTNKTPRKAIKIARHRMDDYIRRNS